MWGESSPTCLLCTHNGHICLPFPGANRDISATFLFHGALFLRIPAQPNGTEVRVSSPQILARPSPTAAHLSSEAAGHSPLPPLSRHGAGRGVRPQAWGTKRAVGQGGQAEGSRAPGLPRTPLPPSCAGGGGSLPGRSGKWPIGPGWPVTRGASDIPRAGSEPGVGGGSDIPETPAGPSPPSEAGLPQPPPQHLPLDCL